MQHISMFKMLVASVLAAKGGNLGSQTDTQRPILFNISLFTSALPTCHHDSHLLSPLMPAFPCYIKGSPRSLLPASVSVSQRRPADQLRKMPSMGPLPYMLSKPGGPMEVSGVLSQGLRAGDKRDTQQGLTKGKGVVLQAGGTLSQTEVADNAWDIISTIVRASLSIFIPK